MSITAWFDRKKSRRPYGAAEYLQPEAPATDDIDLRTLGLILKRHRLVIGGTIAAMVGVAYLVMAAMPSTYVATATLSMRAPVVQVVNFQEVFSGLPPDPATLQTEIDIIASAAIAGQVVDQLGLMDDPEFNPTLEPPERAMGTVEGWVDTAKEWLKGQVARVLPPVKEEEPLPPEVVRDFVVSAVRERLTVGTDGLSYTVTVSFESLDPHKAALIANTFAEAYLADQIERKYGGSRRQNEWMAAQLTSLRDLARESDRAVQEFRQENDILGTEDATVVEQQLAQINADLVRLRGERRAAEARYENGRRFLEDPTAVADSGTYLSSPLNILREQESTVERRVAELSEIYGPNHPMLKAALAELDQIRERITTETGRAIAALQADVDVAVRREAAAAALEDLKQRLAQEMQASVRLRELTAEAEANRNLYTSFLTRYKEASEQQDFLTADARLISAAELPQGPSNVNTRIILALSAVVGTMLGLMLAFLREHLDRGLRGAAQVEQLTGCQVLAHVPSVKNVPAVDVVLNRPRSTYTESLRAVRMAVEAPHPSLPKVIAVTSSVPGEGKTTFSVSFARMMARLGKRVILVEADLHRPQFRKLLPMTTRMGLSDHILRDVPLDEVVQEDVRSGAHYIAAGTGTDDPQSVLHAQGMDRMMEVLRGRYDLVVVDTPPIMVVTDAAIMARYHSRFLFAVRYGRTPRETVAAAFRQMEHYGIDVSGVILTRVDLKEHAHYGFNDRAYHYAIHKNYYLDLPAV